MRFIMTHRYFKNLKPEEFDEQSAPNWLTSKNTIKGSTMDCRWFWEDFVLSLPVGGEVYTDFRKIIRIS